MWHRPKKLVIPILLTAVILAGLVAYFARSASSITSAHKFRVHTRVLKVATSSGPIPLRFKDALMQNGKRVGTDRGYCVAIGRGGKALCSVHYKLGRGQIMTQGLFVIAGSGPGKENVPITGGTGIYQNVRGYVHVRDLANGSAVATFHVIP